MSVKPTLVPVPTVPAGPTVPTVPTAQKTYVVQESLRSQCELCLKTCQRGTMHLFQEKGLITAPRKHACATCLIEKIVKGENAILTI